MPAGLMFVSKWLVDGKSVQAMFSQTVLLNSDQKATLTVKLQLC